MKHGLDARRNKIRSFLVTNSDLDKNELICLARKENLYKNYLDNEEIYECLKRFAEAHDIKMHQKLLSVNRDLIEYVNEDVKHNLKGPKSLAEENDQLIKLLEEERDNLSSKLLHINKLLEFYKKSS